MQFQKGASCQNQCHFPISFLIQDKWTAGESLPTPYHVFDGTMMQICGTVNGTKAKALLASEDYAPVLTTEGRALTMIWVCDFSSANLGPHCEVQFTMTVTRKALPAVKTQRFAFHRLLASSPDMRNLCHGLWNNTERVVAYNRKHLGLDAPYAAIDFKAQDNRLAFHAADRAGKAMFSGDITLAKKQSSAISWQFMREDGFVHAMKLLRLPAVPITVLSTKSPYSAIHGACQTQTSAKWAIVRPFGADDRFEILHPIYQALDFKPDFITQMQGINMVFMPPKADI